MPGRVHSNYLDVLEDDIVVFSLLAHVHFPRGFTNGMDISNLDLLENNSCHLLAGNQHSKMAMTIIVTPSLRSSSTP